MGGSVLRFDRDNPSRDPVPGGQGREGPTTERADGTVRRPSLDGHREPPGRAAPCHSAGRRTLSPTCNTAAPAPPSGR